MFHPVSVDSMAPLMNILCILKHSPEVVLMFNLSFMFSQAVLENP